MLIVVQVIWYFFRRSNVKHTKLRVYLFGFHFSYQDSEFMEGNGKILNWFCRISFMVTSSDFFVCKSNRKEEKLLLSISCTFLSLFCSICAINMMSCFQHYATIILIYFLQSSIHGSSSYGLVNSGTLIAWKSCLLMESWELA